MQTYAAPEEITVPDFNDFYVDGIFNQARAEQLEDAYRAELSAWAKAQGAHKLAGKFVSVPFADGSAVYCIAKVNGKVSLIHVPLGDAWHDDRFCRLATVAELTRMISGAKSLAAIFS
jgi:hypothetical protein